MPPRRPTAFEVSFPDEPTEPIAGPSRISNGNDALKPSSNGGAPTSRLKRRGSEPENSRSAKRQQKKQLPPVAYYVSRPDETLETRNLLIPGESEDDEGDESETDKPIRVLTDFTFFDPSHQNELVSLTALEDGGRGGDAHIEGAGMVCALYANEEEDEGQEDGLDDEDGSAVYVRLGAILRYTIDWAKDDQPFFIETEYAWYTLRVPAERYGAYFRHFYTPRRITQLAVSSMINQKQQSFASFVEQCVDNFDPILGRTYEEDDIWSAVPEIEAVVADAPNPALLRSTVLAKHILRGAPPSQTDTGSRRLPTAAAVPRNQLSRLPASQHANTDLSVLRPENQNPTHVTPRIASLAEGLVQEKLVVVGPPPPPPESKAVREARRIAVWQRVCVLVAKAVKKGKRDVDYQKADRIGRTEFVRAIVVEGQTYRPGDCVLIPQGKLGDAGPPELPTRMDQVSPNAIIADYFWFAKIIYLKHEEQVAHVQWLEHGSQILFEGMAHPQELFLNDLCGHVPWQTLVSKVNVHLCPPPDFQTPPDEYFVKFTHTKELSSFVSVNLEQDTLAGHNDPPDNCPVCLVIAENVELEHPRRLKDPDGTPNGVAINGNNYHLDDFVMYRGEHGGPAEIGYIRDLEFPKRSGQPITVSLLRLGRVCKLGVVLPSNVVRDERHLYLTDERVTVSLQDLLRVCYVVVRESIADVEDEWLELAPEHFYLRYVFPRFDVENWGDRKAVRCEDLLVCAHCFKDRIELRKQLKGYLADSRKNPLRTLDIFGGVGAFSVGLNEGSKMIKVTHAVEISPSAAKTFKRNSPDTLVFNQCANIVLQYAIKTNEGHHIDSPKQLYDGGVRVPQCPKPGEIDVLTAGFPCQTHSQLNMFKVAGDIKSNLILNALSWVDHLRPKFCYFENVPGFLNFNFNATQAGRHRVEGGVPMGGLIFLVRAMTDMGYQCRYGLLQAGNYGTPQGRVRFFFVAARDGLPLPELPQPTHDFPPVHGLQIKLPTGDTIRPIRVTNGTAPHPFVTIDDAIGDLPRFHWKSPKAGIRPQREPAADAVPELACNWKSPHCGISGPGRYHSEPKTNYQIKARSIPTTNLQQYTKCLLPKKVDRVVSIPLKAGADYRSLRPDQSEWQFANPSSSVARANYRPGLYGRLDKNGYFPTTVTNVDPTAKQSRVLNPYCKRMVTVRELARSQGFPDHFVFESMDDNVVTMHRQIGNAVPWQVGTALGRELRTALFNRWKARREEAIVID